MAIESYDEVPYEGQAYPQSHPDRLTAIASLLGVDVAPVERCRVLELGCSDGANLLPMALGLPDATFLGVDAAGSAIARGRERAAALGLGNVRLEHLDLRDLPASAGEFDHIVAHGLWSWIDDDARRAILAICARHLAPSGVAYISYNALPGCHLRQMLREMALFHGREATTPGALADAAQDLAGFLRAAAPDGEVPGGLAEDVARFQQRAPWLLLHDDLAEHFQPFYVTDFVAQAAASGLQFLAEADVWAMTDVAHPPEVRAALAAYSDGDVVVREQYLDFLSLRRFRQTLLCRSDVAVFRPLVPSRASGMFASTVAVPEGEVVVAGDTPVRFETPQGTATDTDPVRKAVLVALADRAPGAASLAELATEIDALGDGSAVEAPHLLGAVLQLFSLGLLSLSPRRVALAATASERPLASALARLQASEGHRVTNLLHESMEIDDDLARRLLTLLDGTRDRAALAADLATILTVDGRRPKVDPDSVDRVLAELARRALLLA